MIPGRIGQGAVGEPGSDLGVINVPAMTAKTFVRLPSRIRPSGDRAEVLVEARLEGPLVRSRRRQ